MKRLWGFILLTVIMGMSALYAQNVLFYGSKQGLSNSRIRNITEDSRHNIWLTTQNGLNRYDGVKWNVYRHEIGNPQSLLWDETTYVFQYEENKMLVGTGAGVQMYDYATDKFTDIPFIRLVGDTVRARTISINRIQDKSVMACFAGYGCGELFKDKDGNYSLRQTMRYDMAGVSPVRFYEDKHKNLWIVNGRDSLFRQIKQNEGRKYENMHVVRTLCESTSGTLYACTYTEGVFVYDPEKDQFNLILTPDDLGGPVMNIRPWTDGRIFVSIDGGGMRIYEEQTGALVKNAIMVKEFDFLTSNVADAMSDSYGNVWVGVYMKGMLMKPINQSAFEYVGQNSIAKCTIGRNSIFSIASSVNSSIYKNGIWVAADNDGLYLISEDGTASRHWTKSTNPEMPHAFTAVYDTGNSDVLLGTFYDGFWQLKGDRFSCLSKEITRVFDIRPAAKENCYWIACIGDGFFYYDHSTGKSIQYTPHYDDEGGTDIIGNPYVYSVHLVKDKLFIGTADGLTVAYPDAEGIIKRKSTKMLGHSTVRYFYSAGGNTVWVATNEGLIKLDAETLEMQTYTAKDGLPSNSITSIISDGHGNLWIGTDYGLSRMNLKDGTFANFFSEDGLQENEFSRGAVASQGGKLYFGGVGGISYFDVKSMQSWQSEGRNFRLRLVDVLVGGKVVHVGDMSGSYEMLTGLIDDCERVDLCHSDNHFTLELGVLGMSNQHVTYEYSINNGKWLDQGGNNSSIIFDNLEPGNYTIKFRATVSGVVTDERTLLAVVHPAWYASIWAKLVYFLLFAAVCWLIYEYVKRQVRLRRIMARNRQQRELNEARVQFFMNISHEIRTPMTLILAPLERLIGSDKDPWRQRNYGLIKQNSKRILRLINQMMDVRKIEQGKFLLDYRRVELVDFLQNIYDVFVTNAQNRGITYTFEHDVDQLKVFVDPDNMDKIVMNLLSNAFKFTPDGGNIKLCLKSVEGDFTLSVIDSGVGIKREDRDKVFDRFYSAQHQNGYIGTGIGLNLTSLLVKLHKGTIRVEDNPAGKGTVFVVQMPVGDESLRRPSLQPENVSNIIDGLGSIDKETEELLTIDKPTDTHRRNAVLVEDDEAIRQYVHSELSKDLVMQLCGNGQEAWDYIVSHPGKVDVVISDIMMPVMDGMTLCQKLKSNFNTNHIPIVLITALGSDADRIAGITNGADAYVSKPFNIDVLRMTVLQLMKSRQLLQGKFQAEKQQEEHIDKVEIESPDEHLMKRVMKVINENLDNPELSVEIIADKVGISRVHFYRKMKDLTGQAPRDFVKYVRLKEASRMLAEKKIDITGVSVATGFKSLSAFSTNFKSLYGVTPTEWVRQNVEQEMTEQSES